MEARATGIDPKTAGVVLGKRLDAAMRTGFGKEKHSDPVRSFLLLSILLAACAGTASVPAECRQKDGETGQEGFRIRVNAALVTADVTVTGAKIPELRADDFVVYDDGVAQQVSHFSRDLLPLAIALVIDRSDSVTPYLTSLQVAALSALRRLRPEDQVALFFFDDRLDRRSNLTGDRFTIGREISKLETGNATNIFDSLYKVAQYLGRNAPGRRRAIILVSDNCNSVVSRRSPDAVRIKMQESSVTLYSIRTAGDCTRSGEEVGSLASETGGEMLDAAASTDLPAALEKAMSNLRVQYTLGFNPSNPGSNGSFHKLTIKLASEDRCPGCRLLARTGYYAGITMPLPAQNELPARPSAPANAADRDLLRLSMLAAGAAERDFTDIPFSVRTAEQKDSTGRLQIKIDLLVDAAGVKFTTVNHQRACRLVLAFLYADSKGKIIGSDWKVLEGLLTEENYTRVMKEGIRISTTAPIKTNKQILKVVVYDEQSDRIGTRLLLPH